jgi:hypothetical protein
LNLAERIQGQRKGNILGQSRQQEALHGVAAVQTDP